MIYSTFPPDPGEEQKLPPIYSASFSTSLEVLGLTMDCERMRCMHVATAFKKNQYSLLKYLVIPPLIAKVNRCQHLLHVSFILC